MRLLIVVWVALLPSFPLLSSSTYVAFRIWIFVMVDGRSMNVATFLAVTHRLSYCHNNVTSVMVWVTHCDENWIRPDYAGCPIHWVSKLQTEIALSTQRQNILRFCSHSRSDTINEHDERVESYDSNSKLQLHCASTRKIRSQMLWRSLMVLICSSIYVRC